MKQNPNSTFVDIMSSVFCKTFAKIVMFVLFIYFLIKTFLMMKSTFNFFTKVIYDELNWIFYLISTLFFMYFALHKSFKIYGRVGEIIFWVVFISINIVLLITSFTMDLTNLLPLFNNGIEPIASTGVRCAYIFGDYTVIIVMMGNINYTNQTSTKIIGYAFLAMNTVINIFIVFLCNFGYTTVNQSLAISDLSLYIDLAVSVSRLEWFGVFAWTITLVTQLVIYAHCTKFSLEALLPKKLVKISPHIVLIPLAIAFCFSTLSLHVLINNFLTYPWGIAAIIVQAGIPILLLIASTVQQRRLKNNVRIPSKIS